MFRVDNPKRSFLDSFNIVTLFLGEVSVPHLSSVLEGRPYDSVIRGL